MSHATPDRRRAESVASYDRHSGKFADRYAAIDTSAERHRFLEAIKAARVSGFVLDAGCGAGRDTPWLNSRQHGVTAVAGLDLSAGMLLEARTRASSVPFARADICRLPIRTAACIGVWALASLVHLHNAGVQHALEEFRRVLRPGGALFVSMLRGDTSDWKYHADEGQRWFNLEAGALLPTLVEQAGFQPLDSACGTLPASPWVNVLARRP